MTRLITPVALIIFNRPDLSQIVFNAIRQAQPEQLFVIADGARFPEEYQKCEQARHIIQQVDWDSSN
jgi:aspartyl/asparaginyl beta-hydroxylase (cupin superfamily)